MDSFNISNFIDEANKYSNDILKDIDIQELLNNAIKGEVDTNQLLKNIFPLLGTEIKEALKVMGSILIIVLIHSVLKSISDNLNNKSVAQITYYVQYILIATVIMTNFSSIITLSKEAVGNMISFIQLLFPLLMTLMLASGSVVSVNLVQPIILFIINLISNIFQSIIIPIILVGTALAIVSKISDRIQIDKLSKFLKSSSVWVIGILLTIFVGVLSIEGTLGSSVDGITAKTAKAAVSSFIPVVGKVLGDAVEWQNLLQSIVSNIPITQTELDFKNFDNLSIWILSDIFETIASAVPTKIIGIIIDWNIFEIKFIINNIIGCTKFTDTTLPEASINVIRRGNNNCIKEIMFPTASFESVIMLEKLVIITVAINIYCT